jgi:hypothetical protein
MEMKMPPPQIYVEKTLAIIKPDIVDKEEEIQDIILRSGFTIVQVTSGHDYAFLSVYLYPLFFNVYGNVLTHLALNLDFSKYKSHML